MAAPTITEPVVVQANPYRIEGQGIFTINGTNLDTVTDAKVIDPSDAYRWSRYSPQPGSTATKLILACFPSLKVSTGGGVGPGFILEDHGTNQVIVTVTNAQGSVSSLPTTLTYATPV